MQKFFHKNVKKMDHVLTKVLVVGAAVVHPQVYFCIDTFDV